MSGSADSGSGIVEEPALDGGQLARWTVEAMRDPSLLHTTEPVEPRSRRLVRDAVRAIRHAESGSEVEPGSDVLP